MSLLIVIITAISLSMDAFSLSLIYGTLNLKKKQINSLAVIVGLFHFFMPLLGMTIGKKIICLIAKPNIIVFIVLFLIGIQMIVESFKENKKIKELNFLEMILFGIAVSIDSFTLGLGLNIIYNHPYLASFIFSLTSLIFTKLGLSTGKVINQKIGKISTLFGGIILIIIGIIYLI